VSHFRTTNIFFTKSDIKTCMTQISFVAMKDLLKTVGINKTNTNTSLGILHMRSLYPSSFCYGWECGWFLRLPERSMAG
jgi:hypothetical protein